MEKKSIDEAALARSQHWRAYPSAKARRIDGFYKSHPTDEHVREVMVDSLRSAMACGSVLDVGCGTGDITVALHDAGFDVSGLDISPGMLEVFRENAADRAIPVIIGDIFDMPAPEHQYDAATCRYVFSHYHDFGRLLGAIAGHVRVGGVIVFDSFSRDAVTTAAQFLGAAEKEISTKVFGGLANFSHADLDAFCAANGLVVEARHPSAFFHRNPLFAGLFDEIADYDRELAAHTQSPDVRNFMAWFQTAVAARLDSKLSGAVVNVIRKVADLA